VTPEDIAWLLTPEGIEATHEAKSLLHDAGELAALRRLGRRLEGWQARAAVALVLGRRAAQGKFHDAASLFLDHEAAEQASPEVASRWTAKRFAGRRRVADLGCGAGADALAIAEHAPVVAVDREPARLAMLRANAAIRGLDDRIEAVEADIETFDPPHEVEAAWLDPSRRADGRRMLDPARWSPPLDVALRIASEYRGAGMKLAPGVELPLLPGSAEVEFISVDGALVEAVAWLGDLARTAGSRLATVLPDGVTLARPDAVEPTTTPMPAAPGGYLYDPDPGVGRAGLVDVLAAQLKAWQLDSRIAYVSSDARSSTPFARRFRVLTSMPFSQRRLLDALKRLEASRVEVMRRGVAIETNPLEQRLNERLEGNGPVLTVALTRVRGEPYAIVCERERD